MCNQDKMDVDPLPVPVSMTFQGKTVTWNNNNNDNDTSSSSSSSLITTATTSKELYDLAYQAFFGTDNDNIDNNNNNDANLQLKLLFKGKRLSPDDGTTPVFTFSSKKTMKLVKIIVMATSGQMVEEIATKRSDPTIRGFEQEQQKEQNRKQQYNHWGMLGVQDRNYKFCKIEACTWQSFGHHRTSSSSSNNNNDATTPHEFEAIKLLETLATDPGIVAIMKERELVVGTLGEMDPIDDRIMQKKQQEHQGSCLLGYNTNRGLRIDIKLRTDDDLKTFRPYSELVATLIHELSHNWVGEHDLLFWTNYGQMRAEYFMTHANLRSTLVNGKTTAELAGITSHGIFEDTTNYILMELTKEMAQHRLHPSMIQGPIQQRVEELKQQYALQKQQQQRLGGVQQQQQTSSSTTTTVSSRPMSARERALEAAERRARQAKQEQQQQQQKDQQQK